MTWMIAVWERHEEPLPPTPSRKGRGSRVLSPLPLREGVGGGVESATNQRPRTLPMPRVFALSAALLLVATTAEAQQASGTGQVFPEMVTANGVCVAEVAPDRASVAVTVQRLEPDPAQAIADATRTFNVFKHDVEALALPDVILRSGGVSVGKQYDYDGQHRSFRGYQASAALSIETSDPQKLAAVPPLATKDRIDDVGEFELFVSETKRNAAIEACLPKATADAKTKAAAMARGVGLTLGPVVWISDFEPEGVQPRFRGLAAPMAAMAAPPPVQSVAVGVQRITVSAVVSFRLNEGRP